MCAFSSSVICLVLSTDWVFCDIGLVPRLFSFLLLLFTIVLCFCELLQMALNCRMPEWTYIFGLQKNCLVCHLNTSFEINAWSTGPVTSLTVYLGKLYTNFTAILCVESTGMFSQEWCLFSQMLCLITLTQRLWRVHIIQAYGLYYNQASYVSRYSPTEANRLSQWFMFCSVWYI